MEDERLSRFDRIVAIMIHLQSGRIVRAQTLADRFQVSLRTIYRDIRSLEASGVPVVGEAGTGYSLMEGYRLPPVMFTREEAGSFVAAEKLMQKFSDKRLGAYYESAMYKIKSLLRGNDKDRLAQLEKTIHIHGNEEIFNKEVPDALDVLLDCIADKRQVLLKYLGNSADQPTLRDVEPVGLFYEGFYWYFLAYCHLRKDYRHFRVDRIQGINRSEKNFSKDHDGMENRFTLRDREEEVKIVIQVDRDAAPYIKSGKKFYGLTSERNLGDKIEMTFMCRSPMHHFARWFVMFADCASIVEPGSLKSEVRELIDEMKRRVYGEENQSYSSTH